MSEEKGIKEITELADGLKVFAAFAGKVLKDNKLSTSDLQYVVDIAMQFDAISKAFDGLGEVPAELKNLKKDELISIVAKFFEVRDAYNEAKKS